MTLTSLLLVQKQSLSNHYSPLRTISISRRDETLFKKEENSSLEKVSEIESFLSWRSWSSIEGRKTVLDEIDIKAGAHH